MYRYEVRSFVLDITCSWTSKPVLPQKAFSMRCVPLSAFRARS